MHSHGTVKGFLTTQWTLVAELHAVDPRRRARAQAVLTDRYWPAVYSWLRKSGRRPDDAAEITQSFFASVVLERHLFERADQSRGRLRTFLLTALSRFVIDGQRRTLVDPSRRPISLDSFHAEESRSGLSPVVTSPSDGCGSEFDHRWALSTLDEALHRCEAHFAAIGREAHWRLFEARILVPCAHACAVPSLDHVAGEYGFPHAAAAAAAVQTVKLRLAAILKEVVAETVSVADDVEDEHRVITAMLRGAVARTE